MVDKNSPVFIACRPTGIIAILLAFTIAIMLSNNASAAIVNGDFETGDFYGWNITTGTGPYDPDLVGTGGDRGVYTARFYTHAQNKYAAIRQDVADFSLYDNVSFDMAGYGHGYQTQVVIDSNEGLNTIFLTSTTGVETSPWDSYTVDFSYTGSGYIEFRGYSPQVWGYDYFDNIAFNGVGPGPSGENSVVWDQYPYYTGETATIETIIEGFDNSTYSYYLDLYNANDYLTTYEITHETEYNYYTFPTEWADTSLLASLVRVTDPYATNEVELAYDVSLFESLYWDPTVAFNKSSYIPSESLLVTWSGAANGSSVWLQAGDDGEVLESDVAYSGSFTFDVPANTIETYYWVDVVTAGYSQAFAICDISPIPDFFFNHSVAVVNDTYYYGDLVNVLYSTDTGDTIDIVHRDTGVYIGLMEVVPAENATRSFFIYNGSNLGIYDIELRDHAEGTHVGPYTVKATDSFTLAGYESLSSMIDIDLPFCYLYDTFIVSYRTNDIATLVIKTQSDDTVYSSIVNTSAIDYFEFTPVSATGWYTAYLYDDITLSDTILVYSADPLVDDIEDDVIEDDAIEDVLEDDETMTEYFDDKFREFAPTAWGIFLLSIVLWLMAILSSFGGSGKRR
jgi:hypothetical protein